MKKPLVVAVLFCLSAIHCVSQNLTQTIRGTVLDNDSKSPLIGAAVVIPDSLNFIGTSTDLKGSFRLKNIPIGRVSVRVSYMGYETVTLSNIEVNSAKEVVLTINLHESVQKLREFVVTASKNKGDAINEMAPLSSQSITLEQTKRFTGGMDDPARVVTSFAGVSCSPDGSSDIIARGNSPKYMQWRLEGSEISSPYHMDDQNSSFGALTALNNNLLATSDFYTSAFSAEYGDVISSVYEVKLRTGNNERFEAMGGLGILGTDLTLEGPFKKGYAGSYLVNYRYSTVSLVKDLGLVDVEGAVKYQDATFKVVLPTQKMGSFTLYGLGGFSGVSLVNIPQDGLQTPGLPPTNAHFSKDFVKSNFLANLGLNHVLALSGHSFLKTQIGFSGSGGKDELYQRDSIFALNLQGELICDSVTNSKHIIHSRLLNSTFRWSVTLSDKVNARNKIQTGIKYSLKIYNNHLDQYNAQLVTMTNINDVNASLGTISSFINWKHSFNDAVTLIAGVHNMNVLTNKISTVEPRVSVNWQFNKRSSVIIGYGLHSTQERIHNYYAKVWAPEGTYRQPNRNLDLLKAHHIVMSYKHSFSNNLIGKIEGYYQYLYSLPVENMDSSSYCTLNEGIDYRYVELINKGTGKNYGIEASVERFFNKNYYFLINATLYESKYRALDKIWRNTRYNNNYIVNILAGKEFTKLGRKQNKVLAMNAKALIEGGQRYIPLLRDAGGNLAVDPAKGLYFDYTKAYSQKFEDIISVNLSVSYKYNRAKVTHEVFLDLMNVTNHKAKMSEYYDESKPGKVGYLTQFGFFPNLMYKIYF